MNLPLKRGAPNGPFRALQKFSLVTPRTPSFGEYQKIFCGLLPMPWPIAAAFSQSPSPPQPSSSSWQQFPSQPSSAQAQPATPAQPPQKEDTLAEAARKAKAKKPTAAKGKVYTEDDLSGMKGPGVSVVGEAPKKGTHRARPTDPNGDGGENNEEYWRGRAQEILGQIAAVDEAMARMKDDIKKYGSGGFDVTTRMKDNIADNHDKKGQLKDLEKRKKDPQKQVDEMEGERRKAGSAGS